MATLSPLYRGGLFSVTIPQLLLHIGYLNAFFGKPWVNGVYWTLAIEFQYYLILGLTFPLLRSGNRLFFASFVAFCAVSQFIFFRPAFLPFHWPLFLMGIVAFRYKTHIIGGLETLLWIAGLSCWAGLMIGNPGKWEMAAEHAVVGGVSALCIMYVSYGNKVTTFLADISYSLYLVHQPIGNRIVNLGARYAKNPFSSLCVAAVAILVSIACAYVLYRWIERPAQLLAGRIRYRAETDRLVSAAASTVSVPS